MARRELVPNLTFELLGGGDVAVITLDGAVVPADADQALDFVTPFLKHPRWHLVVDLGGASKISAEGLGLFAHARSALRRKGFRAAVVRPRSVELRERLSLDLDECFGAFDGLAEAIEAVRNGGGR